MGESGAQVRGGLESLLHDPDGWCVDGEEEP